MICKPRPFINDESVPVLCAGKIYYYNVDNADSYIKSRNWYADRPDNYAYTVDKNKKVYLHRYLSSPKDREIVDHINNDRTDNTLSNLRNVNYRVNGINRRTRTKSKTGIRGVYESKNGKYYAKAGLDYKDYYLGTFDTKEEANTALEIFRKGIQDGTKAVI